LKLFPAPSEKATAFVGVKGVESAVALLSALQAATGGLMSAFELMPRIGLELVLAHIPGATDPLSHPAPWYVLAEAASGPGIRQMLEDGLAAALDQGLADDAVLAESEAQSKALWAIRENLSEAQKREGASIKHDVSVPVQAIPEFIRRATPAVEMVVPGARAVTFGHLGDGNLHFNFQAPKDGNPEAFLARWSLVQEKVHDMVHAFGGSISAEHGIGVQKREALVRYKSAEEIAVMRALKQTFDPNGILNPGKLLA
jgi:FAD/FMN-containing dehydrogenase